MSFDIFGGLRSAAEGLGSVGDAFGASQRAREAERARAGAEQAQQQLKDTLAFIKGLGSQTPEQADRARQQILDGLNATTGAQIQLGDATTRNTIAATDAAGRVRKDLIGAQFSSTRGLLGDQHKFDLDMVDRLVGPIPLAQIADRRAEDTQRFLTQDAVNPDSIMGLAMKRPAFGLQLIQSAPQIAAAGILAALAAN